jgi:hypothetical protein
MVPVHVMIKNPDSVDWKVLAHTSLPSYHGRETTST